MYLNLRLNIEPDLKIPQHEIEIWDDSGMEYELLSCSKVIAYKYAMQLAAQAHIKDVRIE